MYIVSMYTMILMIQTMILGFLAEGPLHGYELRRKMSQLHGYARPISDGTIYPAINRLIKSGAIAEVRDEQLLSGALAGVGENAARAEREETVREAGVRGNETTDSATDQLRAATRGPRNPRAPRRRTLELTDAGRERLVDRLENACGHDITDPGRFFVVLAFLSLVPDKGKRDDVLRRRLEYLETPVSFFSDGSHPLKSAEIGDPYRRGILVSAIASNRAERAWLREQLGLPPASLPNGYPD